MEDINLLGFGVMGQQIAALFVMLGYKTRIYSRSVSPASADKYIRLETRKLKRVIDFSGNGEFSVFNDVSLMPPAITYDILPEDINVKKNVLSSLTYNPNNYLFLTNSSSFKPSEVYENAVGMHFFNPIFILQIVELCVTTATNSPELGFLTKRLKVEASFDIVYVKDNPGYIGNSLLFAEISNAFKLVEHYGYKPDAIDLVMRRMGRTYNLFDIVDLIGIDTTLSIFHNLYRNDNSIYVPRSLEKAINCSAFGRKNQTSIRDYLDLPC
ncbi:3-hydroxyacyl-CoA dehydrogenase NAD-binding domain-containing protein [Sphaerospermopsis torques-reginae]|uniref:3-hydroxyacyl-CoA dehydrogenase n=1 Tax=Sphaerospermopsis torques-reginae ITEP-024 TaxID=984208 RepID=A0ABX8WU63_9CYAN|nr:3-hydroxyacyl-CoA dehydrogenase NAD-binding domain-containing protein [Sphaerospermopsis torques-reginae]QYX29917.1 hypothetical protein K2F26_13105 [Sphaerospermopsis torques-reginae ITEP-024]